MVLHDGTGLGQNGTTSSQDLFAARAHAAFKDVEIDYSATRAVVGCPRVLPPTEHSTRTCRRSTTQGLAFSLTSGAPLEDRQHPRDAHLRRAALRSQQRGGSSGDSTMTSALVPAGETFLRPRPTLLRVHAGDIDARRCPNNRSALGTRRRGARRPLNVIWPALDVPISAKGSRLSVQIAPFGVFFVGSGLENTPKAPKRTERGTDYDDRRRRRVRKDLSRSTRAVSPCRATESDRRLDVTHTEAASRNALVTRRP